ncbi:MAG TPA: peptidoglycan DD-metalloendopeptidase family protein [Tenericutes bacterium]|nr:peptidoglycan DD-metalloendopeptidase family protein [Mycoplasmatota bacterium]
MKKVFNIILCFVLVFVSMIPRYEVKAKTLGDIKKELAKYEADYLANKHEKQMTKEEIASANNQIKAITKEIDQIGVDIINLNNEIEELGKNIEKKKVEIEKILVFIQISNGENAYLEYAFGATDFTDFIYRLSVAEQLTNYNEKLIKQFNENIEKNNKKKIELANKKTSLNTKQNNLSRLVVDLNTRIEKLDDYNLSIEEEIKLRKEAIDLYEKQLGCKDHEDIETCGRNILPPDTAFYRPLQSGTVTSEFGYRSFWLNGKWISNDFHGGIDLSTTDNNTPIYASASGIVIAISRNQSCGKNIVYIQHNVKGETYTSSYWHLRRVTVNQGDRVTKDTQVGIMGGAKFDNDTCSTGPHLHFVVSTGLYLTDYHSHATYNARRINPRIVLNVPKMGVYFKDRITKY